MQKPNSFDEVNAGGDYIPINVGGHHAVIMSVKEQQSSTGKNMVVVALDFARNDSQPGYFKTQFENDDRPEKKWPYQAVQYIVTEDMNGKCSKSFKGFITSFERSNNVTTNWGDNFVAQFKNKKIGVVYGEVEEEFNGEIKTRRRIRWFCEDGKVDGQKIPDKKYLNNAPSNTGASIPGVNADFVQVVEGADEEIPF
jgi:hypothetical protein